MAGDHSGLAARESGRVLCIVNNCFLQNFTAAVLYQCMKLSCPFLLLYHSAPSSVILLPRGIIKVYTSPSLFFSPKRSK